MKRGEDQEKRLTKCAQNSIFSFSSRFTTGTTLDDLIDQLHANRTELSTRFPDIESLEDHIDSRLPKNLLWATDKPARPKRVARYRGGAL